MVDFTSFTTRIPSPVVSLIQGTSLQRAYEWLRLRYGDFTDVPVESECGEFIVTLPRSSATYRIATSSTDGYEPELKKKLAGQFTPETVFYDIGAGFGYFSSLAIECGVSSSNIHAFEADWFRYKILEQTHSSDAVRSVNRFVGDGERESIKIDEYSNQHGPPTIVKIDVEGAEAKVVDGMENTITEHQPILFVELHPHKAARGAVEIESLVSRLRSYGYSIAVQDHRSTGDYILSDLPTDRSYLIEARVKQESDNSL